MQMSVCYTQSQKKQKLQERLLKVYQFFHDLKYRIFILEQNKYACCMIKKLHPPKGREGTSLHAKIRYIFSGCRGPFIGHSLAGFTITVLNTAL